MVNGLTDSSHPCQALADAMTIRERLGRFEGVRVAWVGDGNNVCASLMVICAKLGMEIAVATPEGYEPEAVAVEAARAAGGDPRARPRPARGGARRAGPLHRRLDEHGPGGRARPAAAGPSPATRWTPALVGEAAADAIVLHCLPAHVGEEITEDVLYGPQSAAWDEAENRLHTEKALLALIVA